MQKGGNLPYRLGYPKGLCTRTAAGRTMAHAVTKESKPQQESARWYASRVAFILTVLIYQELNVLHLYK